MLHLFRKKFFLLILVTILLFVAMGVTSNIVGRDSRLGSILNIPLSPFQSFFSYCGEKIDSGLTYLKDMNALQKENENLKAQIDKLNSDVSELNQLRTKNKELSEALNLKSQLGEYDSTAANIIAKDAGNWFNVFTIDAGSKDGITTGSPVITSKGLVGMVIEADVNTSKVEAVIDVNSIVMGRITKSRELVRVKGSLSLKDQGLCMMDYIPLGADLAVGDTVETSGIGDTYPKGITIGKVKEIRQSGSDLSRNAIIEPTVDFKRLEEVIVLKNKNGNTGVGSAGK